MLARAVFVPASRRSGLAFCLDLEHHAALVTPVAPKFDGSFGLRGPREQSMWVLYEVTQPSEGKGRIDAMAMCGWKREQGETGAQAP